MDLTEKADRTFRCVLSGRLSGEVDDTLLQKLLTKLDSDAPDSDANFRDIVKRSDVLLHVSGALCSKDGTSCALSFALQLLSVVVKQNIFDIFGGEHPDLLKGLLCVLDPEAAQKHVSPSVRVAALACLSALVNTHPGHVWVIDNGLAEVGWRNLSHNSVFVQRASENFLASVLTRDATGQNGRSRTLDRALQILEDRDRKKTFEGCVRLLSRFLLSLPAQQLTGLTPQLAEVVPEAFRAYPTEDQTADELNRMAVLFSNKSSCQSTLHCLSDRGHSVSALKFSANYLLSDAPRDADLVRSLLSVLGSPLLVLSGQQPSSAVQALVDLTDNTLDSSGCHRLLSNGLSQLARILSLADQQFLGEMLALSGQLLTAGKDQALLPSTRNKNVMALLQFQKQVLTHGVSLDTDNAVRFLKVHVSLLEDVSLPSATFQASCRVVHALAPQFCPQSPTGSQHVPCGWESAAADSLGLCLSRRLLDRHWEVVDSILELCTLLLSSGPLCRGKRQWFLGNSFHVLLWDMLANCESEGYVRAACIRAVVAATSDDLCWQTLRENKCLTKDAVGEMLCCLLANDPEAFVQRDAARGVQSLLKSGFLDLDSGPIGRTLSHVMVCSLDWEVKVTVLQCWQTVLDSALSSLDFESGSDKLCTTFDRLFRCGCLGTLSCGLGDCDRPVRLLAARTVREAKERVQKLEHVETFLEFLQEFGTDRDEKERAEPAPEVEPVVPAQERDRVLDLVLDIDMRDRITAVIAPTMQPDVQNLNQPEVRFESWQEAVAVLWRCDLDTVIRDSDVSTDVYEDNLSALLDDILAAVRGESEGEEYQSVDCY